MTSSKSHILEKIGINIVQNTFVHFCCILLLSFLSIVSIVVKAGNGLPVDFSPQAIFLDGGEDLERLRELESIFGREDNDLLVLIHGNTVLEPTSIAYLESIQQILEQDVGKENVYSIFTVDSIREQDDMIEIVPFWNQDTSNILEKIKGEPFENLLLSDDGDTILFRVRLPKELEKTADLAPVVHHLEEIIHKISKPKHLEIFVTGVPHVRTEVVDLMIDDNKFFVPTLTCLFLLTISLLFGSPKIGLAPLGGVGIAVLWATGFLLALDVEFNVLSILVPLLALIIGVADGIHVVSRYREEIVLDYNPALAMGRTIRSMFVACFLTTFTTATGFYSLIIADTKVIQDFGTHASIAVLIAFLAVIWVVPTWLSFLDPHQFQKEKEHQGYPKLESWVYRNSKTIAVISLLICGGIFWISKNIDSNSHLLEMYHKNHPTYKAIHLAEKELSGIVPMFINIEHPQANSLELEHIQNIQKLHKIIDEHKLVLWSYGPDNLIEKAHSLLTKTPNLPSSQDILDNELFLFEMASKNPFDGLISPDQKHARILLLCSDAGGNEFLDFRRSIQSSIDEIFPSTTKIRVDVTGDGMMASIGIERLITDLLSSIFMVLTVITITLLILLRNIKLALVASIPNVIPLIFTLGTLYVIGADLQISNIISFTVAVGLAVDDTIHFITRYNQERRSGKSHRESIQNTYKGAGHAIILTTILLVIGFATLATSKLTSTHHFGLLTSVTLITALIADLILLPALLHLVTKEEVERKYH